MGMNSRLLKQALAMLLFVAAGCASAQTASTDIIDSQKPPAGFVAPKPAGARDLSMAKYARQSYLAGEEAVVTLRVLVRHDGSVGDVQIATSSGSARLDQSAHDVVGDWRYQPATVNGAPVDSWVPVNIIWALQTLRFELTADQAKNLRAYYPAASFRSGEIGSVTVRFFVSPDGTVTKTVIEKASGHLRLDTATTDMLKSSWHFPPATLPTGENVGTWFRLEIIWGGRGQRSKDDEACFAPDGTSSADAVILACT
jgi:TonB family protein